MVTTANGGLIWVSSYRSLGSPQSLEQIEEWLAQFRTDFAAAAQDLAIPTASIGCSSG